MKEIEFANLIIDALCEYEDNNNPDEGMFNTIATFEEAGVLTLDKGLVVKLLDGSKFFITIKKG